jgi:hypothetical protein
VPYFEAVGIYCPIEYDSLPGGALRSNILYLIEKGGNVVSCEETQLQQADVLRIEIVARNPIWDNLLIEDEHQLKSDTDRLDKKNISKAEFDHHVKAREKRREVMPQVLRWVYYLSPENGYAVCKHERITIDGRTVVSFSGDSFQRIPGTDSILAGRVRQISFEKNGSTDYELLNTPAFTEELAVEGMSTEAIPTESFVLNRKDVVPGATVIDAVTPKLQRSDGSVITYQMPASASDLDNAITAAAGDNKPKINYILLFGNVAILVFLLCILAFRRYFSKAINP